MRPTALVVDDEFLIAIELETTLQEAGYAVLTAVTLAEAHDIVVQKPIDFAILDFRMGDDSVKLAGALETRKVPFIFCTGSLREEVHAVFPGAKMIAKPFTTAELLEAITALSAAP